ncbi:MAG: putative DNA modification/repair radical SAM protein [Treponema sp.]|jgi:putative DNA modification/repair radical SAM protein|nr:putative DNA modification/repair radical SAM protein [Treponema sp.]
MELNSKLEILSGAAKYDASCASSGSSSFQRSACRVSPEPSGTEGFGVRVPAGVCHSWTGDGRCVSLLKVLYSNVCRFDCAYCVNRVSSDIERASFKADELVELTSEFYRRNYIEGLFLSSGIFSDPDIVMEKLIAVAKTLRKNMNFNGYIHLKIIPGSGEAMIREAGLWADRLSANIELPTEKSLKNLAPQKSGKLIFGAMNDVSRVSREIEEDRSHQLKSAPVYAPAGQSTQLIVGASGEDDRTIIGLAGALYRKYALRRVYYSAYMPVTAPNGIPDPRLPDYWDGDPAVRVLPAIREAPRNLLIREHRLYQADWLMRFYRFSPDEIVAPEASFLDSVLDPKTAWALRRLDCFPVEIKSADYEELLRVPGIGAKSARRIIEVRRSRPLSFDGLKRIGVVLKRARYFITLGGNFLDRPDNPRRLRRILADEEEALQLPLFEF